MSRKSVTIRFTDPDVWDTNRETVDRILEKDTGTAEYPSTKSLPPIIFGPELTDEAIAELGKLQGVIVQAQDDDE